MEILCTEGFKKAFNKLKKNKAYKFTVAQKVKESFFEEDLDKIISHRYCNPIYKLDEDRTLFKKRVQKRSEYRVLFLLVKSKEKFYLMEIFPKTGSKSQSDLGKFYTDKLKSLAQEIEAEKIYKVDLSENKEDIIFLEREDKSTLSE